MRDNSRTLTWIFILAALVSSAAVVIAAIITRQPQPTVSPNIVQPAQTAIVGLDDIVGTWTGNARAQVGDLHSTTYTNFLVNITIVEQCEIGRLCGTLEIPSISCTMNLRLVNIIDKEFIFSKEGCGISDSTDSLRPSSTDYMVWTPQDGSISVVLQRISK